MGAVRPAGSSPYLHTRVGAVVDACGNRLLDALPSYYLNAMATAKVADAAIKRRYDLAHAKRMRDNRRVAQ